MSEERGFIAERILSLSRLGVAVLLVCTVASWFAQFSELADVLGSFHHLFALGAFVCLVALAALRSPRSAGVGAFVVLANVAVFYDAWTPSSDCTPDFTVVTLNALGSWNDVPATVAWIDATGADIVAVTELGADLDTALRKTYPHAVSAPREGTAGMGLFSKSPLSNVVRVEGAWFPQFHATTNLYGRAVRAFVVHPPPPIRGESSRLRNAEVVALAATIRNAKLPVVVGGDLNMTRHSPHFAPLLDAGLVDARVGQGVIGTWPAASPFRVGIDHVLPSSRFEVCEMTAGPHVGSDHLPVIARLRFR